MLAEKSVSIYVTRDWKSGILPDSLRQGGRLPAETAKMAIFQQKEMPDRASLAIRHLVDVQLAAAKTELCVTVVFSEL